MRGFPPSLVADFPRMIESPAPAKPSSPALDLRWLTNRWTGPLFLLATAIVMLCWTWGRYCHPFIDFGRELYVPWRLAAGQVLYRDIDYFNGPVSPYLNSLVFRVFGTSLLSIEIANLFWWVLLTAMAYPLYESISDRLSAFLAMLLFVLLFSFLQLTEAGNDNFITPYSHEMTHALVCAFGMLLLLKRYLLNSDQPHPLALAGCGFLLGLMFLMKVEVTVAAAAALVVGVILRLSAVNARPSWWLKSFSLIITGAIIPPIVAFAMLRLAMPSREALNGLLGSWKYLHDARITDNPFYRHVMGTDKPGQNTVAMLETLAGQLAILLPPAVLAISIQKKSSNETRWVAATGSAGYVLILLWIFWDRIYWPTVMQPLNVIALALLLGFAILAARQRKQLSDRLILQLSFIVFAIAMLSKIFLNVGIHHYGFALAGPAFALMVMLLFTWIPAMIARVGGTGWVFRAAALTALGAFTARYLIAYDNVFRSQPAQTIGFGLDEFAVYYNGQVIDLTLNFLARQPAGQTLAAVPEGAMINYLSRRVNPTGEPILLPGEVTMFGEARILDRFRQHPPDWIAEVRSNVAPFGYTGFGIDYAQSLAAFIKENYDPVELGESRDQQSNLRLMKYDPGHRSINRPR
jgi:4-amino-4-deoxy-L-arabinose transferase-like glycosyltransferase